MLFEERPLLLGPCPVTAPQCLQCGQKVDASYLCLECGMPMCDEQCSESAGHRHRECGLLRELRQVQFSSLKFRFPHFASEVASGTETQFSVVRGLIWLKFCIIYRVISQSKLQPNLSAIGQKINPYSFSNPGVNSNFEGKIPNPNLKDPFGQVAGLTEDEIYLLILSMRLLLLRDGGERERSDYDLALTFMDHESERRKDSSYWEAMQ